MKVIECINLTKSFDKKTVLKDLNVSFEEGRIYALIGRNGAGKTTLLNTIVTKYLPDSGSVELYGNEAYENIAALKKVCFMSDSMSGFSNMRVLQIFDYARDFYSNWDEEYKDKLVKLYGVEKKKRYITLSKGQQTAVSLIVGMASGCPVVLYDEIYSGLDAVARKEFYNLLLNEYYDNNRTFIISTHLIDEMSTIFTDAVIIDEGKVVLIDNMEEIKRKACGFTGRKESMNILEEKNIVGKSSIGGLSEYIVYDNFSSEEIERYKGLGIDVKSVSLQDLFIAMTCKN